MNTCGDCKWALEEHPIGGVQVIQRDRPLLCFFNPPTAIAIPTGPRQLTINGATPPVDRNRAGCAHWSPRL